MKKKVIGSFGFTMAEVLIAKRERGKMSLLNISRTRELKEPSNRFLKQCAFTLAEVLITLGIIGLVAAMTIPVLINNYQKTQFATGAKKAYTQMNQVLLEMANENGTPGSIADYFGAGNFTPTGDTIASHFKVAKNCGWTQDDTCFAKFDDNYDGSANATTQWTNTVKSDYKFITTDGMSFAVSSYATNCTSNRGFDAAPNAPTYNATCGSLYIDVNGLKKPNYYGKDVFVFYITSSKTPLLYPIGGFYTSGANTGTIAGGGDTYWNYNNSKYCGNSSYKYGFYCAGRLMENGWVMDW